MYHKTSSHAGTGQAGRPRQAVLQPVMSEFAKRARRIRGQEGGKGEAPGPNMWQTRVWGGGLYFSLGGRDGIE